MEGLLIGEGVVPMNIPSSDSETDNSLPGAQEEATKGATKSKRAAYQEATISKAHGKKREADVELTRPKRKAYRKLLDETFEASHHLDRDVVERTPASQIGGSYWTEAEKDAFFTALARCGPDDLPKLANAIKTKSQPEIRLYVLLLRQQHQQRDLRRPSFLLDVASFSASHEIDVQTEGVLDRYAYAYARNTFDEEVKAEQQSFGQQWLIDESLANETADDSSAREDDTADLKGGSGEEVQDRSRSSNLGHRTSTSGRPSHTRSLELLSASNMLLLSRTVFMNGNNSESWHAMGERIDSDVATGPAVFQSALEDFYDEVVQATRQILQATILQAMSRIRARDRDSTPQNVINEDDVRNAADLLDWTSWQKFWAHAARRGGLHVYSEASQYKDGRQSEKNGVPLTYEEVELALGVHMPRDEDEAEDDHQHFRGSDLNDSTSESAPEHDQKAREAYDHELAPSGMDRETEEADLIDAQDARVDQAESRSLLERLGERLVERKCSSPEVKLEVANGEIPPKQPEHSRAGATAVDWRSQTRHMAGWEQRMLYDT